MPGPKRACRERTEEWASIKQWTLWPEQELYEQIRPIILFGQTAGERAGEEVSVWVYEDTLKVEYQTTALSLYSIAFQPDHERIAEVTQARRIQTPFRSPQLDLWQLAETEWLLALRRPERGARSKRSKLVTLTRQLPLPEVGATG